MVLIVAVMIECFVFLQWLARFLDKGSVELLASKFYAIMTSTDICDHPDELKTASNILDCFSLLSQRFVGLLFSLSYFVQN
jgi:hypothetical protein